MRIVFVRHGHPDYARDCLTERGRAQAQAAACRLAGEGIVGIFASSMGRAVETASFTASLTGATPQLIDGFRELRWGNMPSPWELADLRVAAGIPLNDPDWRSSPDYGANLLLLETIDDRVEALHALLRSLGYTREGAYYRVSETIDTRRTIAVFGHGGQTSAHLSALFNLPFPFVCQTMGADFTGVTIVQLPDRPGELVTPRFEIMNDARHIVSGDVTYGQ